jgi:uncharacterized membrane protein YedE/YeeE
MSTSPYSQQSIPPKAEGVREFTRLARIIAILRGIIALIAGLFLIIRSKQLDLSVFLVVTGAMDLFIYFNTAEILSLIDKGEYEKAKEKILPWTFFSIVFGGVIVGFFFLLAYTKFDEIAGQKCEENQ